MSLSFRLSPSALFGVAPWTSRAGKAPEPRNEPTFDGRDAQAAVAARKGPDVDRLLAAARAAPELAPIEWDGDGFVAPAREADDVEPRALGGKRRKIRDRYVSARFPGVARNAADLADAPRVIKSARLYFEEEDLASATELLTLAMEEAPGEASLALARLEILFLSRERDAFVEAAWQFRAAHRNHEAWGDVARLGRAIAPGESIFGAEAGPRDHDHYGPWPDLPNWIQAPWDLTPEILATDFHRAMQRAATVAALVPRAA